ncbi:pilin [Streptomyces sp. NPDC048156]|uniref:pilin n=1 Tax=Streptomyces sp. NPDC048156 TaxID=3365502 RepID=UPI003717A540
MLVRLRPPRAGARRHARRRRAGWNAARLLFVVAFALVTLVSDAPSSWAVADIPTVINNLRTWIVGLLAGLATLFLTFGGLRYLMAGGDPGEVESAKRALKAAAIGYGLAVMAPVLVTVLQGIVGAGGGGGQ